MRIAPFAALVLLVPLAAADTESGRQFGVDLGDSSFGVWEIFQFDAPGGTTVLHLTWADPPTPIPFADYNLFLYGPGAFDDNTLADNERIAQSWKGGGARPELINVPLAAGRYWVAVAPWQTQGETYTLTSNAGTLSFAATAQGFQSCSPCP